MPQTLLIVDDSKAMHELIKAHLGTEDFVLESAYSGSTGLDAAALLQPDLILLDVDLPDMNGFDVCRFLKTNTATSKIPVIFLTAAASPDEKVCGLELQAIDYITKPFNCDEFVCRVRAALRTKRLLDLLPAEQPESELSVGQMRLSPSPRLTMSQLLVARSANPWNRKSPAKLASG